MNKAKLITADGKITEVTPKNGEYFKLDELQAFVGGYIEVLCPPSMTGALLIVNEEGKCAASRTTRSPRKCGSSSPIPNLNGWTIL